MKVISSHVILLLVAIAFAPKILASETVYLDEQAQYCDIFWGLSNYLPLDCTYVAHQANVYVSHSIQVKRSPIFEPVDWVRPDYAAKRRTVLIAPFPLGSAELTGNIKHVLKTLSQVIKHYLFKGQEVVIVGHTDASGSEQANQVLAERRAIVIFNYLTEIKAVPAERLAVKTAKRLLFPSLPLDQKNRGFELINQTHKLP